MSLTTEYVEITSLLTQYKYKEIPENLEYEQGISSKAFNMGFVLKHIDIGDFETLTSNRTLSSPYMELQLHYIAKNSSERLTAIESVKTFVTALKDLDNFSGFISNPTIEDLEPKHIRAVIEFNYGLFNC